MSQMPDEKNLTPEEKLLNVIQGKDKAEKSAQSPSKVAPSDPPKTSAPVRAKPAAAPAAAQPVQKAKPAPVPPARPAPQAAPSPAQSSAAAQASGTQAQAPTDAASAQPSGKIGDAVVTPPVAAAGGNLKPSGPNRLDVRSRTLAIVNRILRVAVLAMLGLCGWVVWTSCVAAQKTSAPVSQGAGSAPRTYAVPPGSCAAMLPAFEGRFLFAPPVGPEGTGPVAVVTNTPLSEAQQYAARSLNLIGVSPGGGRELVEAIVVDIVTKRNYFLKVGDKITLKNWDIELRSIAADHAIFVCGKEEIRVQ
jgi:hypothetical protein